MQEIKYSGMESLTMNPTDKDIEKALRDKENKTVIIHNVGSIITRFDGSQYEVWKDGSLRKIKGKDTRKRGKAR